MGLGVSGRFNVVSSPCETNRRGRVSLSIPQFAEVIHDLGLKDLSLQGGPLLGVGVVMVVRCLDSTNFLVSRDGESYFSRAV